jgi:hypothetical protein
MAQTQNELKLSSLVGRKAAAVMAQNVVLARYASKAWESEFGNNKDRGLPTGSTINIRKPGIITFKDNVTDSTIQAMTETQVPLTLEGRGADIGADLFQSTLQFPGTKPEADARFGKQIGAALGAVADTYLAGKLAPNYTFVGSTTDPMDAVYSAGAAIEEALLDYLPRKWAISSRMNQLIKSGPEQVVVVNQGSTIAPQGGVRTIDDTEARVCQALSAVNVTAYSGSFSGLTEGGSTLTASATAGLYVGMPLTLGVNGVNYNTKADNGIEAQRTIVAINGSTVTISEPVYTEASGKNQNVAATTIADVSVAHVALDAGTYAQGILMVEDSLAYASMFPVYAPSGATEFVVEAEQEASGLVRARANWMYSPSEKINRLSINTLLGGVTVLPQGQVRVLYKLS